MKFKLEVKILDNLPQKRTLAELLMNLALDLNFVIDAVKAKLAAKK